MQRYYQFVMNYGFIYVQQRRRHPAKYMHILSLLPWQAQCHIYTVLSGNKC